MLVLLITNADKKTNICRKEATISPNKKHLVFFLRVLMILNTDGTSAVEVVANIACVESSSGRATRNSIAVPRTCKVSIAKTKMN